VELCTQPVQSFGVLSLFLHGWIVKSPLERQALKFQGSSVASSQELRAQESGCLRSVRKGPSRRRANLLRFVPRRSEKADERANSQT